jgi:hypothetical protein
MLKIPGAKRSKAIFDERREIGERAAKMGAIAAGDSGLCPQPRS